MVYNPADWSSDGDWGMKDLFMFLVAFAVLIAVLCFMGYVAQGGTMEISVW